ncbi:hypothetical protein [Cryobacterium sp. SO1]|uniref:hypothetical protein n=1 Tax=Cryobacterium sp. SO1 TaxID=1897061 RepID=UPI0010DBB049|nr:hypothetical protein BJQ95_02856 [Cryobacterium sp. SO1]
MVAEFESDLIRARTFLSRSFPDPSWDAVGARAVDWLTATGTAVILTFLFAGAGARSSRGAVADDQRA